MLPFIFCINLIINICEKYSSGEGVTILGRGRQVVDKQDCFDI